MRTNMTSRFGLVLSALRGCLVITACCLVFTTLSPDCYAQTAKAKVNHSLEVSFATSTDYRNIHLQDILEKPILTSLISGCQVSAFTVSFLPKGGEFFGPYKMQGSLLTGKQLDILKENKNSTVRIFFEDIHASCDGRDSVLSHIIVTSNP